MGKKVELFSLSKLKIFSSLSALGLLSGPPWRRSRHRCARVSSELTSLRRGSSSASGDDHVRSARCGLWLPPVNATKAPPRAILYSQGLYSTLKGYSLSRATQSQGLLNLKGYSLSRGLLTLKGTVGCATAARSIVGRSTRATATAARTTAAHSTSFRSTADCCTANRSLDDRSSLNRPSLAPSTFALASA